MKGVDQAGNVGDGVLYYFTLDTTAPFAGVTAPAAVTSPVVVTFSEDVTGVAGKAGLSLTGGAAVPASVSCRSAAGAVVACDGTVRKVVLQPTRALVPGQHYTATVAAGAKDAAGNAAAARASAFRAQRLVQESSPSVAQAWSTVSTSAAYGGRYVLADVAGASASYAFTGTGITWYTVKARSMGTVRVYVDGVGKGTVNNYSATTAYRVARAVTGLKAGTHTLRLVVTGSKGSTAGTGTGVAFDAVKVGTTLTSNPAVKTAWAVAGNRAASAAAYAVEDRSGAAVSLTFRGTSISWTTITGTTMGKARVYVDGVLKGTYDDYASSTHYGVKRTWATKDGVHTVKIVVLGSHWAGGKGNRVVLDALTVG